MDDRGVKREKDERTKKALDGKSRDAFASFPSG